jgi:hypothetical protein
MLPGRMALPSKRFEGSGGAVAAGPDVLHALVRSGQRAVVVERGDARVILAKGLEDGFVGAWQLEGGVSGEARLEATQLVALHQDMLTCIEVVGSWYDACGMFLLTASADCSVRVHLLGSGVPKSSSALRLWAARPLPHQPLHVLHGHRGGVTCLAASASLDVVVSGDALGKCMVHTLSSGRFVRSLQHPNELAILLLQVSAQGDIFMCGEGDKDIYTCDLHGVFLRHTESADLPLEQQQGAETEERDSPETSLGVVSSMVLSRDGSLLVIGDISGQVVVRDSRSLSILRILPRVRIQNSRAEFAGAVLTLALSPCNNYLLVGTQSGHVLATTIQCT